MWGTAIGFQEKLVLARNLVWRFKLPGGLEGNAPWLKQRKIVVSRKYGHSIENDNHLDRDFLVQLWVADRKMKNSKGKRRRKLVKYGNFSGTAYENQHEYGRWYSGAPLCRTGFFGQGQTSFESTTSEPICLSFSGAKISRGGELGLVFPSICYF